MPTNRKRTVRGRRGPPIDPDDWAFLCDRTPENPFTMFQSDAHWRKLWSEHGDRITQEWAAANPGTRPDHWWKYSAPRLPVDEGEDPTDYDDSVTLPRLQVGGAKLDDETQSYARGSARGIPNWNYMYLSVDEPEYPADPPVFESEAAYLKRHGLLLPGEAKLLKLQAEPAKRDRRPAVKGIKHEP